MSEASYAECRAKLSFHLQTGKAVNRFGTVNSKLALSCLLELLGNSFIVLKKNKLFKLH